MVKVRVKHNCLKATQQILESKIWFHNLFVTLLLFIEKYLLKRSIRKLIISGEVNIQDRMTGSAWDELFGNVTMVCDRDICKSDKYLEV